MVKVGLTMLEFELILVGLLLFFVAIGVHIVIALGVTAVLGVWSAGSTDRYHSHGSNNPPAADAVGHWIHLGGYC